MWELGKTQPNIQSLQKLSIELGVSVDYIIDNTPSAGAASASMGFGDRIKALRAGKGLTQVELAERLGTKQSTLRMWELGKAQPNFQTLLKLSDTLGVSVDFIVGKSSSSESAYPAMKKEYALGVISKGFDALEEHLQKILFEARKRAIQELLASEHSQEKEGDIS